MVSYKRSQGQTFCLGFTRRSDGEYLDSTKQNVWSQQKDIWETSKSGFTWRRAERVVKKVEYDKVRGFKVIEKIIGFINCKWWERKEIK